MLAHLYSESSSSIDTFATFRIRLEKTFGIVRKMYQCTLVN